ncbi:nucleotide exchange factor GrpE [Microvirga arsenatis]|uniref:Protein GrpE n=1 Tax=Microvirga arsenatis TaxID=2692265 RepID=A0ABW9YVQ9_9HYPH|nr:nucleotide exchange factor GrpE [Microvirga arsenatis]NBJ10613.1 nucleotide exchange factor GrpE [Microvirga arsenatis]NBJ24488.1 nucleotide exchange factor GrpE [Microvirga arsenatis]
MNPNDTENQNAAPQAEPANDAAPEAASAPEADPIAVLEAEKADLKDKLLRLMADMENLRRRTEREIADARTYAVANFARDMLNVADNIRRAIESVPEEASKTAEGAFKGLIEGIDLTERDMLKTLERHGVKRLDPQGQKFDPNLHQAMFEIPNAEVPNGTVLQVVQSGYVIGERVLRPALVGVSKGGPKAAANGAGAETADNSSAS